MRPTDSIMPRIKPPAMAPQTTPAPPIMTIMKALIEIGPPMPELTPVIGHEQAADNAGEHGADREADHRVAVDVDAHELRGHAVLGQGAHGAAGAGVLHEEDEGGDGDDREDSDEHAVVGHDDAEVVEHAVHDLRHAALLLAEDQEDDGVEEEGESRPRAAWCSPRAAMRRMTVRKRKRSHERADDGERHGRGEEAEDEGQAERP